jgi:hypothetical protein
VPAGGSVSVTGSGFGGGDLVAVSSTVLVAGKPHSVQSSTTSSTAGTFAAVLTFPSGTQQGRYTVTARDFSGHAASTQVTILPVAVIHVGAQPTTTNVIPLHRVWVNATGFSPNETVSFSASFPLYNGNTTSVQTTRKANGNGNVFGLVLNVPGDARAGNVTLTATGATSKKSGTATLHVMYRPQVSVKPSTIRPGTSVSVSGREFVPNSTVQVSVGITYSNGVAGTIGHTVTADGNGNFATSLYLPPSVRVGTYTVVGRDITRGFRGAVGLRVSVSPTIKLNPTTVYPGQTVTVSGTNFGTGSTVHVSATVHVPGGTQQISNQTVAGSGGGYSTSLHIPGNTQPGNVVVTARTVNASVRATLHVSQRPTAVPTAQPTAAPQPTATPTPHHTTALGYRYISVWYHWMRQGTREHIIVQSTLQTKLGIWVHVWYPNGQHQAWFQNTDDFGQWSKWFTVPYNSATPRNDQALVTFRLWHGKDNVKNYAHFGIVR